MKFSVIIPCYNESDNIVSLVKKIIPLQKKYDLEYILVENGSTDNSKVYFRENIEGKYPNICVEYVEQNKGYGFGVQQGIKVAGGEYIGWIHADMQIGPKELEKFFDYILNTESSKPLFLKGNRKNLSSIEKFFTGGQSVLNSFLFRKKMYDVGAIPVLFDRVLLNTMHIDEMPNDFSIEIFVYLKALERHFKVQRFPVFLRNREKGTSSWNKGLSSKIRQSRRIFKDSVLIKKGEKVL